MAGTKLEKFKRQEEQKLEMLQDKQLEIKQFLTAGEMFGAVRFADALSRNLAAQTIRGLEAIQKNEGYKSYGFETFDEFLDNCPIPDMSKSKYYERRKVLELEGDEVFSVLSAFKVPISTRKLIGEGQIQIDGDQLIIGDQRADLTDMPTVKDLIKELANENRTLNEKGEKKDKEIDSLKEKLNTGAAEYEELRRAMDAQNDGTPYERALSKAISALINLALEAKKLPLVESQNRGRGDVEALWKQMLLVRHALYQDDFVFIDEVHGNGKGISKRAMQVLAEDDDFGDEDEQ
jgi:hypothetical protein